MQKTLAVRGRVPAFDPTDYRAGYHHLDALDGLRFLAAFCILFHHSCSWVGNFNDSRLLPNLGEILATYGMTLFFVLSGFVIHYNYSHLFSTKRWRWAALEFAGARFARLYPLFIALLAIGFLTSGMLTWMDRDRLDLVLVVGHALTLTQSWVYVPLFGDRTVIANGFGLSWSISTEIFFYVCYACWLARPMARLGRRQTLAAMLLLVLLAIVASLAADRFKTEISAFGYDLFGPPAEGSHSFYTWLTYYSPFGRIPEFLVGCLTAQLFLLSGAPADPAGERPSRALLLLGAAVLAIFGLWHLIPDFNKGWFGYIWLLRTNFGTAIPIAIIIYAACRHSSRQPGLWLAAIPLVALGELSYSIYAVHAWTVPIFVRPAQALTPWLAAEAPLRILASIAVTLVVAFATFHLIEKPARAALRRRWGAWQERRLGPPATNGIPEQDREWTAPIIFLGMLAALAAYQFAAVPLLVAR